MDYSSPLINHRICRNCAECCEKPGSLSPRLAQSSETCIFPIMSGNCALCRATGDLQNSHIIPEFFYTLVYDHPHRYLVLSTDPSRREHFRQKGLREHLLCNACEQCFSRWENYAKTAFVNSQGVQSVQHEGAVWLRDLDYAKFKLFLLSLLWRMGASKLDFFKAVALGPHAERIRVALLRDDPLSPDDYPCLMVAVEMNGNAYFDWITAPSLTRHDGYHVYWLVINGVMYSFYVSSHPPPTELAPGRLNRQGEMIIVIRELTEIPCLWETAKSLIAARDSRKQET
jgi:hypothetical protein